MYYLQISMKNEKNDIIDIYFSYSGILLWCIEHDLEYKDRKDTVRTK